MDRPIILFAFVVGFALLLFLVILLIQQNKSELQKKSGWETSNSTVTAIVMGIAMGTGLGVALGLVMDNLALGIAIGAAIGTSTGARIVTTLQKEEVNHQHNSLNYFSHAKPQYKKNMVLLGFMMVLLGLLALGFMLFFNI